MQSNKEPAARRHAAENVNLDDSTSSEERHVQHRGGKHRLQLPQYRERHTARQTAPSCMEIQDVRSHVDAARVVQYTDVLL